MCKTTIDLTLDMDVRVKPCGSLFQISIVTHSKFDACDFLIVRDHAIFRGI
jgi:hypothetical protein